MHVNIITLMLKIHEVLSSMKCINIFLMKTYLLRSDMLLRPIQLLENNEADVSFISIYIQFVVVKEGTCIEERDYA